MHSNCFGTFSNECFVIDNTAGEKTKKRNREVEVVRVIAAATLCTVMVLLVLVVFCR